MERFSAYIPYRVHQTEFGEYSQQVIANQYASFLAELAEYYLHSQRKEGIYYILHSLEYSTKINNEAIVIRCVDLFEQYRHIAAEAEKAQYKLLIREVQNLYGKKNHNAVSFM
ncbi:hypothetical protein D3C75_986070 [compost metagenome]